MAYCTLTDITDRFPSDTLKRLTQDDNVNSTADSGRISAAIADADAVIDSKLHKRYTCPITPVPAMLLRIACDIALYYIYKARYDATMPEQIQEAYNGAIAYLDALKDGTESLIGVDLLEDASNFVVLTNQKIADKIYSQTTLDTI